VLYGLKSQRCVFDRTRKEEEAAILRANILGRVVCLRGMMSEVHIHNHVRLHLTPFSDSLKIKVRKSKTLNAMQE